MQTNQATETAGMGFGRLLLVVIVVGAAIPALIFLLRAWYDRIEPVLEYVAIAYLVGLALMLKLGATVLQHRGRER